MGNEIPVQVLNGEVTDELENWCAKRAELYLANMRIQ